MLHLDIGSWEYNQNVLLKDQRIKEKQSFKHFFVYIPIKYRKLQCIKKFLVHLIFLHR